MLASLGLWQKNAKILFLVRLEKEAALFTRVAASKPPARLPSLGAARCSRASGVARAKVGALS